MTEPAEALQYIPDQTLAIYESLMDEIIALRAKNASLKRKMLSPQRRSLVRTLLLATAAFAFLTAIGIYVAENTTSVHYSTVKPNSTNLSIVIKGVGSVTMKPIHNGAQTAITIDCGPNWFWHWQI